MRNVLGNVYLSSLTKNLWYEEREQLDSGGGGALSLVSFPDDFSQSGLRDYAVTRCRA